MNHSFDYFANRDGDFESQLADGVDHKGACGSVLELLQEQHAATKPLPTAHADIDVHINGCSLVSREPSLARFNSEAGLAKAFT